MYCIQVYHIPNKPSVFFQAKMYENRFREVFQPGQRRVSLRRSPDSLHISLPFEGAHHHMMEANILKRGPRPRGGPRVPKLIKTALCAWINDMAVTMIDTT